MLEAKRSEHQHFVGMPQAQQPTTSTSGSKLPLHLFDGLTFFYLALVGLLVLLFHSRVENWPLYVFGNFGGIACLCGFIYLAERSQNKFLLLVRDMYPLLLYSFLFKQISTIVDIFFPFWLEPYLIQWDLAIFGTHPTVWVEQFRSFAFMEFMAFSYWSYYILFPFTAFLLYYRSTRQHFYSFVFSLSLTLYLCYFSYLFLTARSPQTTLAAFHTPREIAGIFDFLVRQIQGQVSITGAAFPSSHVAAVWIMLIYLFQFKKWIGFFVLPFILSLTVSVVFMQYHYAIDAFAGILVVAGTYPLSQYLEKKFHR